MHIKDNLSYWFCALSIVEIWQATFKKTLKPWTEETKAKYYTIKKEIEENLIVL